jgi:drug/metabolite transporter (DMT)-like permease
LTLVFSLPILHKKAKITLIPGVFSWEVFKGNFQVSYLPYLLAFIAAISWGLYSILVRRWAGHTEGGAVPLFLLVTGLVLTAIRFMFPEEPLGWPHRRWSCAPLSFGYWVSLNRNKIYVP